MFFCDRYQGGQPGENVATGSENKNNNAVLCMSVSLRSFFSDLTVPILKLSPS